MIRKLLKWLTIPLWLFAGFVFLRAFWSWLGPQIEWEVVWLAPAGALAAGAMAALFERRWDFARTLEHELTHLVFALLCFQPPRSLRIDASGEGEVSYRGRGNFLISLAPYFFPLLGFSVALLSLVVTDGVRQVAGLAILFAVGRHVVGAVTEIACGQQDIHEHGRVFSLSVVTSLGLIVAGTLIGTALEGPVATREIFARCLEIAGGDLTGLSRLVLDGGSAALVRISSYR